MRATTIIACLSSALFTLGAAQTVAPSPQAPASRSGDFADETVTLSPFNVTHRQGRYTASNSISATGIRTEIKEVPMNIVVVTNDLFRDQGIDTIGLAARNASSVATNARDPDRFMIRGFEVPRQYNREPSTRMTALFNADRVEVIKGPSAVFHGLVAPGGIVNVVSARPSFTPRAEIDFKYGSFDLRQARMRYTGPLFGDKAALNVVVADRQDETFRQHAARDEQFIAASVLGRPNSSLELFYEFTSFKSLGGNWHNAPFSHPAFIAAVNAGTVAPNSSARAFLNAQPAFGSREPQSRVALQRTLFGTEEANVFGPQNKYDRRNTLHFAEATWTPNSWLSARVAASKSNASWDLLFFNNFRPQAGSVPGEWVYRDSALLQGFYNDADSLRFEVTATKEFAGMRHRALVGYNMQDFNAASPLFLGPAVNWSSLTRPVLYLESLVRQANGGRLDFPSITWIPTEDRFMYAADQISMLEGKLNLMVGVRHTTDKRFQGGRTLESSKTTPQAGLVLALTPSLSVYASYSEAFEPQNIVDALGQTVAPVSSAGLEAGLKLDFPARGLSATIALFTTEREGIATRDFAREAALGIQPIFLTGGRQELAGAEADVFWVPDNRLQLILNASFIPTAETVSSPDVPQQVGVRLENTPEYRIGLWARYAFSDTPTGFYVGAGASYQGETRLHSSWDVPLFEEGYFKFDALLGYRSKLGGVPYDLRLNVENVFDELYYDGIFWRGSPLSAQLSLSLRF